MESSPHAGTAPVNRSHRLKKLSGAFLLVSLVFTIAYLYRQGLFFVPENINWSLFTLGVFFALVGHLLDAASWHRALIGLEMKVPLNVCTVGTAFAIFGKYIPGKVWMIAGRTLYLKNYLNLPALSLTNVVLLVQVIMLWSGMVIGIALVPSQTLPKELLLLGKFALLAAATALLFLPRLRSLLSRYTRHSEKIPAIRFRAMSETMTLSFLTWAYWSLGYIICIRSVYDAPMPYASLGAFPLAAVIGILALIVPGGIGVREGIIGAYFVGLGVPVEVAATLSVLSRLWFFASEVAFAVYGWAVHLLIRKVSPGSP